MQHKIETMQQTIDNLNIKKSSLETEIIALQAKISNLQKQNDAILQTFTCAICLENLLENNPVVLDCGHLFCKVGI